MMRYYINLLLPADLEQRIKVIEREWQGENSASPPHLTLLPPRKLSREKTESDLVSSLLPVSHRVSPFAVLSTKLGFFGQKENIHICIERTAELVHCYKEVAKLVEGVLISLPEEFGGLMYPHISLASHLLSEKGELVWQELRSEDFAFNFDCKEICLFGKGPDDEQWRVIKNFPLAV